MERKSARTDIAAAAALVVLWSAGFVGAELGTRVAAADTLLAWRYIVAALALGLLAAARGARFGGRALLRQGVLGLLLQVLYLGGVVTGIAWGVPSGTAALIAAAQPLLVAAAAGPLLGERTGARQRAGLVLGLAGVGLVVAGELGGGSAPAWAFLLPVGGMVALSVGTLLERRWDPAERPLDALTLQTITAAGVFVGVAAARGHLHPPADPAFWVAVGWLVVLASFGGYGTYLLVLRRSGAVRASTLLYLTPPTTIAWAYLMFGDMPGPLAVPGIVGCALAVYLARSGTRTPPPTSGASTASAPALLETSSQVLATDRRHDRCGCRGCRGCRGCHCNGHSG